MLATRTPLNKNITLAAKAGQSCGPQVAFSAAFSVGGDHCDGWQAHFRERGPEAQGGSACAQVSSCSLGTYHTHQVASGYGSDLATAQAYHRM
jgi:hypothetical protein